MYQNKSILMVFLFLFVNKIYYTSQVLQIMWLSTILITITLKAVISNNIEHESSIQNALKIQHNNTYQNQINLQMLFGDIIANSMRQFLPFSNDNYNCTRDGLLFMEGLNNQSIWSIQSELHF